MKIARILLTLPSTTTLHPVMGVQCFNTIRNFIVNIAGAIKIVANTLSVQPKKASIFIPASLPHSLRPSLNNELQYLRD